jgi:hypothetical protein
MSRLDVARRAFDLGDYARVRREAMVVRDDDEATAAEREEAREFLRKIAPSNAVRFAVLATAILVLALSLYFIVQQRS